MEQLYSRLEQLSAARQPVADALASIIYPINTMPPEIMGQIFLEYVAAGARPVSAWPIDEDLKTASEHPDKEGSFKGTSWYVDVRATERGPQALASVCRSWREIVLNLQTLWCRLRMVLAYTEEAENTSILQRWLSRAGDRPLDLDLRKGVLDGRLLDILASYSSQWRTFACMLDVRAPIPHSFASAQDHTPLLTKLTIATGEHHRILNAINTETITVFSNAPCLREVTLYNLALRRITLPWAQLVCLDLYFQSVEECADVLRQTSRLETLSAVLSDPHDDTPPRTTIRLDHLHTLTLSHPMQRNLDILAHLDVPALRYLDIYAVVGWAAERLTALMARSKCQLHSIWLTSAHLAYMYHSDAGITALCAAGAVRNVYLPQVRWPRKDLAAFFARITADSSFLPSMETLCIEQCRPPIPYGAVAEMLHARWSGRGAGSNGIKSFRFTRSARAKDWDIDSDVDLNEPEEMLDIFTSARLAALVEEGLEIDIQP
ncbi:hypothetical protein B0H15DRAFT_841384 [Mycena belliarum]|uniref:F-box domain-containing protein n=1 Tax=Mycena belliarum TaxID=1033014 RepID=A0AAD6U2S7_9AGAR|nr:hypothetical protein B0H15DRAFT_841384 [Mycena belliae]